MFLVCLLLQIMMVIPRTSVYSNFEFNIRRQLQQKHIPLPKVQDQGDFNCCYVCSSVTCLDYIYTDLFETEVSFSVKYAIDYDLENDGDIKGEGGLFRAFWVFIKYYGGIPLEREYPSHLEQGREKGWDRKKFLKKILPKVGSVKSKKFERQLKKHLKRKFKSRLRIDHCESTDDRAKVQELLRNGTPVTVKINDALLYKFQDSIYDGGAKVLHIFTYSMKVFFF